MFRRILWSSLVILSAVSFVMPIATVGAHELLPQNLVEFLEDNPHATSEEVEAFLEQSGADARQRQKLVETVFIGESGFWHNAWQFIVLGVEHILIGLDHILFVVAIMLSFASIRATLKSITTFTIAHSITLIIAGSGLITLSARIVEPIIALSIVFVAIGTTFCRHYAFFGSLKSKLSIIFLFGLFHGLGFAGLLQDFSIPEGRFISSLLFFNVGIELGQLLIIATLLLFIYALRGKRWYATLLKIVAVLISMVALLWFTERVFDVALISQYVP